MIYLTLSITFLALVILFKGEKNMALLDDISAAVSANTAAVNAAITFIQSLQAGSVDPVAAEAQVAALKAATDALLAATSTPAPSA